MNKKPTAYQASKDGKEFFVAPTCEQAESESGARATPLYGTLAEIIVGLLSIGALVIHLWK